MNPNTSTKKKSAAISRFNLDLYPQRFVLNGLNNFRPRLTNLCVGQVNVIGEYPMSLRRNLRLLLSQEDCDLAIRYRTNIRKSPSDLKT